MFTFLTQIYRLYLQYAYIFQNFRLFLSLLRLKSERRQHNDTNL